MSALHQQALVVESAMRGIRLTEFLERHVPGTHRLELREHVTGGGVRINGETALNDCRLRSGDIVEVGEFHGERELGSGPVVLPTILFESDSVVVVAKPAGTPTVPDRSGRDPGVYGSLQELRADADLRIVHRLDRDTSGCLVLAKGLEAARHFDAELRAGRFKKHYRALVEGVMRDGEFAIDSWLGPDSRRPGKVIAAAEQRRGFRSALTRVALHRGYTRHSLVDLWPRTGRGHQLRVHLASIGHPIVGDRDYGGRPLLLSELKRGYKPRLGFGERPVVGRMFLHALGLEFRDVDGSEIAVDCPMPEDLAIGIAKLERFSNRPR